MLAALLIHSNGMPEIVQAERWGQAEIGEVLRSQYLEAFAFSNQLLMWQVNDLDRDLPVNEGAEALVGDGNYFHLRGRTLVTHAKAEVGLSEPQIASLTARLAQLESRS